LDIETESYNNCRNATIAESRNGHALTGAALGGLN
jgi:hypothetical protein